MHYWEEFLLWIINCFGPWSANHWVEPQQQCQDYYLWPTSSKGNKLERVNSLFHFMKWHENDTFCEALCGWCVGPKLSNNAVATIALLSSPPYAQQNTAHYALTHCSLNTWHAHTQLNIEAGTFCEHVCDQVKVCVVYFFWWQQQCRGRLWDEWAIIVWKDWPCTPSCMHGGSKVEVHLV